MWKCSFKPINQPTAALQERVSINICSGRYGEGQQNPCHGSMDSRFEHKVPHKNPDSGIDGRPPNTQLVCCKTKRNTGEAQGEANEVNPASVKEGYHKHRYEVVRDGEGRHKDL